MRLKGARGFTLIELVLILLIIGILSTIAVYTYYFVVKKARQVEAKVLLSAIYRRQIEWLQGHDLYTYNLGDLDVDPNEQKYYRTITLGPRPDGVVPGTTFLAAASANLDNDPDLDVWSIDDQNRLTNVAAD